MNSRGVYVPCVNRPSEWDIHGTVNWTTFCSVLRVTWCHCVCFLVLSLPKAWYNKCVQLRGFK